MRAEHGELRGQSRFDGSGFDLRDYIESAGVATLYTNPHDSRDLVLDLTNVLQLERRAEFLVTVMAAHGSYLDYQGQQALLHEPLEGENMAVISFQQSPDGRVVDVLMPQYKIRTSDEQTRYALHLGVDSPWVGSIPRLKAEKQPESQVLVDGIELILNGFFVTPALRGMSSYRIVRTRAYPNNFDVTVDFLDADEVQRVITFSITMLPEKPMQARASDDRLGYFTVDYQDRGVHKPADLLGGALDPQYDVDSKVSVIWRYNLAALPNGTIRVFVDPSVPGRWRAAFKEGIEAWNAAFALVGHPSLMRAVLPTDPDWPTDYDAGDARFNTITWSVNMDSIFSMGTAKVDPRSGEIIKSDIIVSDGWVSSFLEDLEQLEPRIQQVSAHGYRREERSVRGGAGRQRLVAALQAATGGAANGSQGGGVPPRPRPGIGGLLAGRRPLALLAAGRPREDWRQVAHDGIRAMVMHETGHILGLRHNFKGSLGVSYECTQNVSCSAEHGLTASIMDYVGLNVPDPGVGKVDHFTRVLGAYDKLAIRYGYMDVPQDLLAEKGPPEVPAALRGILHEAEAFQFCKDGDYDEGQDPLCEMYDATADPLRSYGAQLQAVAEAHRHALQYVVPPGEPFWPYADTVAALWGRVDNIADGLVTWVGGVNTSYTHRAPGVPAPVQPIGERTQRDAVAMLLRTLQPRRFGLYPPATALPYMVARHSDGLAFPDLQQLLRERQERVIGRLLEDVRIQRLAASHGLGGLGVDQFLADLVLAVVGPPGGAELRASHEEDWGLQTLLAKELLKLEASEHLPAEIATHVSMHIGTVRSTVRSALKGLRAQRTGVWRACAAEGELCECAGEVRYGSRGVWSKPVTAFEVVNCTRSAFEGTWPSLEGGCECAAGEPGRAELLRTHLLRLQEELGPGPKRAQVRKPFDSLAAHRWSWPRLLLVLATAAGLAFAD